MGFLGNGWSFSPNLYLEYRPKNWIFYVWRRKWNIFISCTRTWLSLSLFKLLRIYALGDLLKKCLFFFPFLCTLSRTSIIFLELSFLCRNLLQSCGVCTVSHSIRSECFLSFGYIKLLALTQCLNSFQVLAIDGWVSCAPLLLVFAEWGAAVCHSFGRLLVPIRSLHLMLMGAACTPSHPKSQVPPWSTLLVVNALS